MPVISARQLLGIAGIALLAAISLSDPTSADRGPPPPADKPREPAASGLASQDARYTLLCEANQLVIASVYGRTRYELDLSIDVDGSERPIAFKKGGVVVRHDGPSPSISAPF